MAPSAIEDMAARRDAWKTLPSPTLYPVKEAQFEKYMPPQTDGHERALAQPQGQAAIIIDNGKEHGPASHRSQKLTLFVLDRILIRTSRVVL